MAFFDKILRLGEGRDAKRVQKVADRVNALGPEHEKLSDDELKARTGAFRERIERGEALDDLLPEAFATVREAAWRVLGQRPYDVQVFGGIVLHGGNIAEMRTGEGKTLTSTMPVYLNALSGNGVHVVTVNDYLARRDAEWMGRVHNFMGLEVGLTYSRQPKASKRRNYAMDITHGTTNEFGFDFLRDNMAWDKADQVQRGHHMALIDEVDSILVDEARTPLIISGQGEASAEWYGVFARKIAPILKRGEEITKPGGYREQTEDYVVDEAKRNVAITEQGVAKVEEVLGMDNLYESVNTPLIQHLQNCLKAKELFQRDREYIVDNGEVKIVDESTGRVLEGRRYSEGLHQAIEAKEGVKVKDENQTLATITLQNYYRGYDKLAGMTGTAKTEEVEFLEIYELGVVVVPTNMPIIRDDKTDLIYKTADAKFAAVADDIAQRHVAGQPVLVGTTDVAKSEQVHQLLDERGIPHEVLNAKNHTREGLLVAQAGRPGAVTVSTNMAGRGTDIQLGGNAEELAREDVNRAKQRAEEAEEPLTDEQENELYREAVERHEAEAAEAKQQVLDAGGLYVIGTERHESRRIDNQLRGRSGRQGDPGASKFYLSLEDDLMRLFNANAVESIMKRLNIPDDVPIEAKLVGKAIENAQGQVESRNFDIRKNVLKYDDVLNEQRKVIYEQRQRLLEGDPEDVEALAQRYVEKAVEDLVDEHCPPGVYPEEWTLDDLQVELNQVYDTEYDVTGIDLETVEREDFLDDLIDDVDDAYTRREEEVGGEEVMREVERRVILSVVDRHWREHLYEMDALRQGIGLRAVGQRDPLVEYQREAYDSFVALLQSARREAVTYFFRIPVDTAEDVAEGGDGEDAAPSRSVSQRIAMPGHNAPKVDPSGSVAAEGAGGLDALRQRREAAAQQPASSRVSRPAAATAPVATRPDLGIAQPSQPRLTYSSGGGGSASYGVKATKRTSPSGAAPSGAAPSGTAPASAAPASTSPTATGTADGSQTREDGTTVREVARGETYTKDADDPFANAGPNDPCPCGSGKKFKKCHRRSAGSARQ